MNKSMYAIEAVRSKRLECDNKCLIQKAQWINAFIHQPNIGRAGCEIVGALIRPRKYRKEDSVKKPASHCHLF
jgi:hypothetical protein